MFDFSKENTILAREWILKLFENKKFYRSAIYKNDEVMWDAIIKYEEDPHAFPELEEDQFEEVFSAFCDEKVLIISNFPCLLKEEHFVEKGFYDIIRNDPTPIIAFTISKEAFDYKTYLGINSQFFWIAFVDQKSGRTMIALPELNFLIYP